MRVNGIVLALLELFGFFTISSHLKNNFLSPICVDPISYYWLSFTVMTGIWEFYYVCHRKAVKHYSDYLISKQQHVWTNYYNLFNLYPSFFSKIFYSEYGAFADREYIRLRDIWSLDIEGTHAFLCGLTSLIGLLSMKYTDKWLVWVTISMSCQLMNSILYMAQYLIEIKNPTSINYDQPKFPCGRFLLKRPFMYINIFWTIMPIYILFNLI